MNFFYCNGALMAEREIPGVTQLLEGGAVSYYEGQHFVCESTSLPAAKVIAAALGGTFVDRSLPIVGKRVMFVGWGRAGKDEASAFAEQHLGLRYGGSTSWHAKEDVAKRLGIHPQSAWESRHNSRKFWYDTCNELRAKDTTVLIRRALEQGEIIAGIRDKVEFDACVEQGLFDAIVWVDRPGIPPDLTVTFTREDVLSAGGHVINNDGPLTLYHLRLILFFRDTLKAPVRLSSYALRLLDESL